MLPINSFWYYLAVVIFLSFFGCQNPTEPQKLSPPTVVLTPEDASCTEIWLRLQFSTEEPVNSVTLSRNDSIIYRNTIFPADTVFFDAGLEPNRVYLYKAVVTDQKGKQYEFSSEVRTLDTTSSDYLWQTFVFGQHSHSIIRDIAVIDENNIWAVGEIYLSNGLGNDDPSFYNVIHWNGEQWKMMRVYYYQGTASYLSRIPTVKPFDAVHIWFGSFVYMENDSFYSIPLNIDFRSQLMDIAGPNPDDIIVVGNNGNLAHYNGTSWTKLESQTNLDLTSIAYYDGKYFMTGHNTTNGFTCLLRMENNIISKIFEGHGNTLINGLYVSRIKDINWVSKYGIYVNSGKSLVRFKDNGEYSPEKIAESSQFVSTMDGIAHNNFLMAGSNGNVAHFNGVSLREFNELRKSSIEYISASMVSDILAAGGYDYISPLYSKAVISIGKKIR